MFVHRLEGAKQVLVQRHAVSSRFKTSRGHGSFRRRAQTLCRRRAATPVQFHPPPALLQQSTQLGPVIDTCSLVLVLKIVMDVILLLLILLLVHLVHLIHIPA
jgi:hypothetical protein